MIVAVTGGTGFIGKELVERLVERGDTVRLLARRSGISCKSALVEVHQCDLVTSSTDDLSSVLEGVDVLYHCAGQLTRVHDMRVLHVEATQKLARAASHRISHWVQLSSVGVYGQVAEGMITESSALKPVGEYETTKAESDNIVAAAASRGGFSYSILRPSNVFGAGMTNQSLLNLIAMIDRGFFFFIGKPGASANYIHVRNVVEGLIRCASIRPAQGSTYNISDYCTIEHFVEVIADMLGRAYPRLRIPEPIAYLAGSTLGRIPGFPLTRSRVDALANRSIYPISLIQQVLGYNHVISMEDGLQEIVEVYKQRRERYVLW